MSETLTAPAITGPVGEAWPDHPWTQRTGRQYFRDNSGDRFKNGEKISTRGKVYIRYVGSIQVGFANGRAQYGPKTSWWELIENPKTMAYAVYVD